MEERLESLVKCNFLNMSSYLNHDKMNNVGFVRNSKLWRWCRSLDCWNPAFIAPFCQIFPSLVMKIVRLPIKSAKTLLEKNLIDKALLLVRDPRATMASR